MSVLRIVIDASPERLDAAALVWSEATTARDRFERPNAYEVARSLLASVVANAQDPLLFSAISADGATVGFALTERSAATTADLRYFAVSPAAWGEGIGGRLLQALTLALRSRGYETCELWVYGDNHSAVSLYEKHGWRFDGLARGHVRSGRTEHHYRRALTDGPE